MHVCKTLSNDMQTCIEWVEFTQPSLLPELTLAEGNAIGFACLLVFATVFVINMCKKALK